MVDRTDVPNYLNLASNNEKLSLPFKKASYWMLSKTNNKKTKKQKTCNGCDMLYKKPIICQLNVV